MEDPTTLKSSSSYKWIAARIESLDPYNDYEEIVRLSTCYYTNDFLLNLGYAIQVPSVIRPETSARAIWREDGGKTVQKANMRVEDSSRHNMTWLFYGPSSQQCQSSVNIVNNIHARLAQSLPDCYFHETDGYIHTLASAAIFPDRLNRRLGLPGYTTKQKIATHLFNQDLSKLFFSYHLAEDGSGAIEKRPLPPFPESWEEMERWCDEYESRDWANPEPRCELLAEAIYAQFGFRYFPPGLRWLGRVIAVSLSAPRDLRAVNVQDVHPWTRALVTFVFGWLFWVLALLPDPKEGDSFVEKRARESKEEKKERLNELRRADGVFCPYFSGEIARQKTGCVWAEKLLKELQ